MKKISLLMLIFALGILLVAGGFSNPGYAKGSKKKAAQVEQKATKPATSKKTVTSNKATTKTATTVNTRTTAKTGSANETDALLRSIGTSQAEIQAMIKQSAASATSASPAAGEQINWQVISGGGGFSSSTNFKMVGVIGQTAVGMASSTNFNLNQGFLQNFSSAGCCVTPGDYTHDGTFNIADVTAGISRIFSGGVAPACQDEADANGDNTYNIADVTFGIARIFSGGPAPVCGTTGS